MAKEGEIRNEKDLDGMRQLKTVDYFRLEQDVYSAIKMTEQDYNEVGWGFRVFQDNLGDIVLVPETDKWKQGELGDLQVIIIECGNIN